MPVGILSDAAAVALGGLLGTLLGKRLPERVRDTLPIAFGLCSMAIGISLIVQLNALAPVILSVILGTAIGEWVRIEAALEKGASKLKNNMQGLIKHDQSQPDFVDRFVSLLVLFCTSSTGILGAMTEGMTGDSGILMAKSILDLFTSMVFATSLGILVSFICIPQLAVFFMVYLGAEFIMPIATQAMIGDFKACGGIISVALGLRLCGIMQVRISNYLPALVLVMPLSWLWSEWF